MNLIGYIIVFYWLIENSYASVHIACHVWTWRNMIKQFFYVLLDIFFVFMQWHYGKFILKQLDYSPSFFTSDSQLGCARFSSSSLQRRPFSIIRDKVFKPANEALITKRSCATGIDFFHKAQASNFQRRPWSPLCSNSAWSEYSRKSWKFGMV